MGILFLVYEDALICVVFSMGPGARVWSGRRVKLLAIFLVWLTKVRASSLCVPICTVTYSVYTCILGETGASWSKNCIFANSDFNIELLLLVWHFTLTMIIFLTNYIDFSLNIEIL